MPGIKNFILIPLLFMLAGPLRAQSVREADSLAAIGENFADGGFYLEAESALSGAVDLYRQLGVPDTARYLETTLEYADVLYERSKFDDALFLLDEMYNLSTGSSYSSYLAAIQNFRGLILRQQNRLDEALRYYREALSLAEAGQDTVLTAILYDNIGSLHRSRSNFAEALDYRKQALQLFEKVGTDQNLAITLNNIGVTYMELSMYDRAFDYMSRSVEIREQIGNVSLLASGYANMATIHYNIGNYDQALIANRRALEYAERAGRPSTQSRIYGSLGNLYNVLGDLETSLEYYRQSLDIMLENNILVPDDLSLKYKNLAGVQSGLGQIEQARQNYLKALELRKQTGNARDIAFSYVDMSQIEEIRGDFASAMNYALLGKEIADSLGISSILIDYQIQLGNLEMTLGRPHEAISTFRSAYIQSLALTDNYQIIPLIRLASAFHETGSDSAIYYGERAVEVIESTRQNAGEVSALRTGFFERHSSFFITLATWYLEYEDNLERAFNLVETSKARVLAEELLRASLDLDALLPERERIEKTRLLDRIDRTYSRLEAASSSSERDSLRLLARQAELEYAALVNELGNRIPVLEKFSYPSPVSESQARAMVDHETAILQYAFADDNLLIFLITSNGIEARQVDITTGFDNQHTFGERVKAFRDLIETHAPIEELLAASARLADYLIRPYHRRLEEYENIIIAPDGALSYLPFEALTIDGRFLIEDFNIKYIPSLTTFSLLREPNHTHKMDLLAFAGSDFRESQSAESGNRSLDILPSTLAEVNAIASKFQSVSLYTDGSFSEAFVKEALQKPYRFIHLATHGLIDEDRPGLSGLLLSGSDPEEVLSSPEDGLLRSSEIYQLSLHTNMVVLSACNTGFGKVVEGEGMLGLQRSFFFSGVPTVTVSLWNVYDRATALLMDNFYTALLELDGWSASSLWSSFRLWAGWDQHIPFGTAARAMRVAKLEMIRHPSYQHPIYWAPFIVVGR